MPSLPLGIVLFNPYLYLAGFSGCKIIHSELLTQIYLTLPYVCVGKKTDSKSTEELYLLRLYIFTPGNAMKSLPEGLRPADTNKGRFELRQTLSTYAFRTSPGALKLCPWGKVHNKHPLVWFRLSPGVFQVVSVDSKGIAHEWIMRWVDFRSFYC